MTKSKYRNSANRNTFKAAQSQEKKTCLPNISMILNGGPGRCELPMHP